MAARLATIRKQIAKLESQAAKLERGNEKGIKAVHKVMQKHGVTLDDLQAAGAGKGRRSPMAGKKVAPKYRDKANPGNIWSGRGRPPLWLVEAEKAGRKRDSFLIK